MNFQIKNEFVQVKDKFKCLKVLNDIRFCELLLNQFDLTFEQLVWIFDEMINDIFWFYCILTLYTNDYTSFRKHDQMLIHDLMRRIENNVAWVSMSVQR